MSEERQGMDDPAMRLTYWLADQQPTHYSPRNDIRKVLRELIQLRKLVTRQKGKA